MATFTNQSKNSASWVNQSKNIASWANNSKSASEIIYLVSEALDYYLIGSAENETLVTQDAIGWANQTKN